MTSGYWNEGCLFLLQPGLWWQLCPGALKPTETRLSVHMTQTFVVCARAHTASAVLHLLFLFQYISPIFLVHFLHAVVSWMLSPFFIFALSSGPPRWVRALRSACPPPPSGAMILLLSASRCIAISVLLLPLRRILSLPCAQSAPFVSVCVCLHAGAHTRLSASFREKTHFPSSFCQTVSVCTQLKAAGYCCHLLSQHPPLSSPPTPLLS